MLKTGTVLQDRFEIVREIGRGGMGAVYEGRDRKFNGSRIAIKQCLLTSEQMKRAFFREASLLAGLEHPYLPDVREHFVEDDGHFLVMKFIEGEDLENLLLKRGGPFAVAEVKPWIEQLLDALAYMHGLETPVIHRDIKPGNIKLTPNGHIKLLDFGLAKGGSGTSITGYSLNYAAPEQMQESGSDARSDLYSLGATMYRLLSGQHPKSAFERSNALLNDLSDPLIPLSQLNPGVPEAISQVIAQTMALKQKDRIPSATELRHRLTQAFDGKAGVGTGYPSKQVKDSDYGKTIVRDSAKHALADYQPTIPNSALQQSDISKKPIMSEEGRPEVVGPYTQSDTGSDVSPSTSSPDLSLAQEVREPGRKRNLAAWFAIAVILAVAVFIVMQTKSPTSQTATQTSFASVASQSQSTTSQNSRETEWMEKVTDLNNKAQELATKFSELQERSSGDAMLKFQGDECAALSEKFAGLQRVTDALNAKIKKFRSQLRELQAMDFDNLQRLTSDCTNLLEQTGRLQGQHRALDQKYDQNCS